MDFAVPADVKIKEDKKLDLARELLKLWTMKVMVIPIIAGALGIITKNQEKILGELKIREKENQDYPDNSTAEKDT